jgi:poly-gamma-glutamate biosynthesis protein PgsC/CapC
VFVEAIGMSLVASLLSFEVVGLSPGGLVVPGYLALVANRPQGLAVIAGAGLITLVLVKAISEYVVLFSRRRFVCMVLVGLLCMRGLELAGAATSHLMPEAAGLGYIVPGLLANDMERQGVLPTLLMATLAAAGIRLALLLLRPRAYRRRPDGTPAQQEGESEERGHDASLCPDARAPRQSEPFGLLIAPLHVVARAHETASSVEPTRYLDPRLPLKESGDNVWKPHDSPAWLRR